MSLTAALLSQIGLLSSATHPNLGLSAELYMGLTWACLSAALLSQQGLINSATRPNMGLSAQPYSLTWDYQLPYSANKGLSAALRNLTWAYQHSLT